MTNDSIRNRQATLRIADIRAAVGIVFLAVLAVCAPLSCSDMTAPPGQGPVGDVKVSESVGNCNYPAIVWTGQEYGIAWEDPRDGNVEIYFARLDAVGTKLGSETRVSTGTGDSTGVSIAWSGTEYGLTWTDRRHGGYEIYFARLSASGELQGAELRVTNNATYSTSSCIAWTGTEYGLVWNEAETDGTPDTNIYFTRIDALGVKQGNDIAIVAAADSSCINTGAFVWTGTQYGMAWYDYRNGSSNCEIYFARYDASGTRQGAETRLTNAAGYSWGTNLVWNGSVYAVTWSDVRTGSWELYGALVSDASVKISGDNQLTNRAQGGTNFSYESGFAWNGTGYGLVWYNPNSCLWFFNIDAAGIKQAPDLPVGDPYAIIGYPREPVMLWNGSEYALAWTDNRNGSFQEIYFARLSPDCVKR
ncbi:MAG: hypothetical protein JXD23_06830 [Spirochaetales bacterium]|nr:hypothetical protein [Spirochaetales bacterium]